MLSKVDAKFLSLLGTSRVRMWTRRPAILTGFSWLLSIPTGKCGESPLNYVIAASFDILSNSYFTNNAIIWDTDSVIKYVNHKSM
jgi:hypothetical protein